MATGKSLSRYPAHLGLGATTTEQPEFTGDMSWYAGYGERNQADGFEGRLVSMHTFSQPWDVWEMHPNGSELVLCTKGQITLIQEQSDGSQSKTILAEGDYAINAPGVWHTADVDTQATAVFITSGAGTEHRQR